MRYFRVAGYAGGAGWPIAAVMTVAGCLLIFIPARAMEGHWTISGAEGMAMLIVNGNDELAATQGQPVVPGARLVTGSDGKIILVRRGDSMTVYPNSEVTIPGPSDNSHQGVVQSLGRLLFRMETRDSRDFEVRTPLLAATVKGTVFTVEVSADEATVTVAEGSVLVAPVLGGRSELVEAGNRASVKATSANQVDMENVASDQSSNGDKGRTRGKQPGERSREAASSTGSQGRESRANGSQGGGSQGNGAQGNSSQGNAH